MSLSMNFGWGDYPLIFRVNWMYKSKSLTCKKQFFNLSLVSSCTGHRILDFFYCGITSNWYTKWDRNLTLCGLFVFCPLFLAKKVFVILPIFMAVRAACAIINDAQIL